ncbi:MAG: hypothetical protein U0457_18990 [Candidatus Sericytochromatia bacterium]
MDSINSFNNQIPKFNLEKDNLDKIQIKSEALEIPSYNAFSNDNFSSLFSNNNSLLSTEISFFSNKTDNNFELSPELFDNNKSEIKENLHANFLVSDFLNQDIAKKTNISNHKNIKIETIKDGNLNIPSVNTTINGIKIHISPKALQQIMKCETYVKPPGINIKDGAGVTIGYGHTQQGVSGMPINNKQDAVNVLAEDVKIAIKDKFRAIPKDVLEKLNQDQLNALASVAMNTSSNGFKKFAPVAALNDKTKPIKERIENANKLFMSGLRKGFKGLVWRRATEALTFSGVYVSNPAKDSLNLARQKGLI